MPFQNEISPGHSLQFIEDILAEFNAEVRQAEPVSHGEALSTVRNDGSGRLPMYVIGIDGSSVTERVRSGFRPADASIITLSAVLVDLERLAAIDGDAIPSPSVFYDIEKPTTFAFVLPGANNTRKDMPDDDPLSFYRHKVAEGLDRSLENGHETLSETLSCLWDREGSKREFLCPECDGKTQIPRHRGACSHCGAEVHVSDSLSLWKSFNPEGSCGLSHGEFRSAIEVLSLVNILRFFAADERIRQLPDFALCLDGPLGTFGNIAKLSPHIKSEVMEISERCRKATGRSPLIFGLEKSGAFKEHLEDLDYCEEHGPRKRLPDGTAIPLSSDYIARRIVQQDRKKEYGSTTYFGRKILYKSKTGQHAVINTAIVNEAGNKLSNIKAEAFPRLQDLLTIFDELGTHLYLDGFVPSIRAHAHASIPLRQGCDILKSLFDDGTRRAPPAKTP